ncbi:hypothetical protein U8U95_02085 [Enterococcus faecium]|uniref:hypothetical protein n=1 Tax=Enterococcus faecium TaxID=1352 RepID=UPI00397A4028
MENKEIFLECAKKQAETKIEVYEFVGELLKMRKTKRSPQLVVAIAELLKSVG